MKFGEFMADLKKNLRHVYLLAGEERYYIDQAKAAILKKLLPEDARPGDVARVEDLPPAQLVERIETVPFFTERNVLLVEGTTLFRAPAKNAAEGEADAAEGAVQEPTPKGKKGKKAAKDPHMERLLTLLAEMPEDAYVIFVTSAKIDKRKKLTKAALKNGALLEADPVRAWNIDEWLRPKLASLGKTMDRDAYLYFTGVVSMMEKISLAYLDQEMNKLALFSKQPRITKAELLTVFAGLPEVSVFALSDAISAQDAKKALALLTRELADGTYFTVILALLARHVRQLLLARLYMAEGKRGRQLAEPLGLNPFIAEKLGQAAAKFTDAQLKTALLRLADADYLLKTGQGGEELLEQIVIGLCQKRPQRKAASGRSRRWS